MSEKNGDKRAVDTMLDAIRAEEPPDLDWDRVEASLLSRIRRGEGARPAPRPASGPWTAITFALAAAVLPIAISLGSPGAPSASPAPARAIDISRIAAAPGEAGVQGERDLRALRGGDTVESAAEPVTFTEPGAVRWTLSPDSRLTVRAPIHDSAAPSRPGAAPHAQTAPDLGALRVPSSGHVLRLERGTVRVEVEPHLAQRAFMDVLAVEVGNTRVAVHGTVFTVTVRDGEVLVDVERGIVTVGPAGQRGATTGYQIPAGSRAAFTLDGAKRARWLPRGDKPAPSPIAARGATSPDIARGPDRAPKEPARDPAAAPADTDDVPRLIDPPPPPAGRPHTDPHAAAPATGAESPSPTAEPPAAQPPEPPARPLMTTATVQAGLKRCFLEAHPPSSITDTPTLTATSTLSLDIDADGTVKAAKFNPPLPSIQGCASFVYGGKFAPAAARYTLSIPVNLRQ